MVCFHGVHISGTVYSVSADRVVGEASIWLLEAFPFTDSAEGTYTLSMQIPDQDISISDNMKWSTWSQYRSDSGTVLLIPAHRFAEQENRFQVEYVYIFLDRKFCATEIDGELFVWPADRIENLLDIPEIREMANQANLS